MTDQFVLNVNIHKLSRKLPGKKAKSVSNLKKIGDGLNGIIFKEGDTNHAIKIYRDTSPERSPVQLKKIEAMIDSPPAKVVSQENGHSFVRLAWPNSTVWAEKSQFVGFAMPLFQDAGSYNLRDLLSPKDRQRHGIRSSPSHRIIVAYNLSVIVNNLHSVGHHIIDLKPDNLKVYGKIGYVGILDCDGFSIRAKSGIRYASTVATEGYIAPETRGKVENFNENQDRFALAVIIFQLLNEGLHPYKGRPHSQFHVPDSEQERIDQNIYPCGIKPDSRLAPHVQSFHEYFESETRSLFDRAFLTTSNRPSPQEWCDHLKSLLPGGRLALNSCPNGSDHFANSRGCAHCAISKITGFDIRTGKRFDAKARKTSSRSAPPSQTTNKNANSATNPSRLINPLTNAQLKKTPLLRQSASKYWIWAAAMSTLIFAYVLSPRTTAIQPPASVSNQPPTPTQAESKSIQVTNGDSADAEPNPSDFFASLGAATICSLALNRSKTDWDNQGTNNLSKNAVREAKRRNYTLVSCQKAVSPVTPNPIADLQTEEPHQPMDGPEDRLAQNQSDAVLCRNIYSADEKLLGDLYSENHAKAFLKEAARRRLTAYSCMSVPQPVGDNAIKFTPYLAYVCNPKLQFANLRSGPDSKKYRAVAQIANGEMLNVMHQEKDMKGWLKVRVADGREGWIFEELTTKTPCGIY